MKRRIFVCTVAFVLATCFLLFRGDGSGGVQYQQESPALLQTSASDGAEPNIADVLNRAVESRDYMASNLQDYTATFVKQEADENGKLGEESVIELKVQSKFRNESNDAPMRVYLKFIAPESVKGREIIWGEDLYDGQMAVHETGLILGWKTLWLDPNGMIAMQGQKHPISEIGLKRLVEKLVSRGEANRDDPHLTVQIQKDFEFQGLPAERIQVRRAKPNPDDEDDFALAEITVDSGRQLIVQYRSFGWPRSGTASDETLPLLESYTYKNVETNVGLTDEDFDVKNADYNFP